MIIKYVLTSDGTIPDYVEDGGYFVDPDDATEAKIGKAVASGIPSDAPATTVNVRFLTLFWRCVSRLWQWSTAAHPYGVSRHWRYRHRAGYGQSKWPNPRFC